MAISTIDAATEPELASDVPAAPRLESVDLLRGIVMVLMVLDHTRDFFADQQIDPTDLDRATPALFFTRWVTHFCAPVFVFLAGAGAFLAGARGKGKTRGELARFLLVRGIWLIVLEETWMTWTFFFTMPKVVLALILWAIGWSMIALAGLIYLPRVAIGAIGVGMIAGHNLLDGVQVGGDGVGALLWRVLHVPGFVPLPGGFVLFLGYPLVPWIGVMAAGYAFGGILLLPPERRRPILVGLGLALTLGFVALRASNLYGDPRPWAVRSSPIFTVMSFLNCQKYPPSLLYLLMTLGPAILALAWLDRGVGPLTTPLRTIGRVPLFYYLLQWPLIHGLAVLVAALRGQPVGWLCSFPPFADVPPGYGFSLPGVYAFWIAIVGLLYLPCRWFADLKRRRSDPWLSYL
jgi:uncharacterized membrane protein